MHIAGICSGTMFRLNPTPFDLNMQYTATPHPVIKVEILLYCNTVILSLCVVRWYKPVVQIIQRKYILYLP